LAYLQHTAPGPDAINQGIRHHIANLLYTLNLWLTGAETRRAWQAHTDYLIHAVLDVARRDPGARILVVVNVRHCHIIRAALRDFREIRVVKYSEL
jgi:hypothetical protein